MTIGIDFHKPVEGGLPCPQCGHEHKAVRLLPNDGPPPPRYIGYAVVCEGCGWHAEPREYAHNAVRAWNKAARKGQS